MAKFILGATEKIKKDDSIPVELLPSNKLLYCARLNNDEEADVTPVKCTNLKDVFEKFRPSFSSDARGQLQPRGSCAPPKNSSRISSRIL